MAALDFLYAFMIAPLRGAMEIVLAWAYALTGSWGWAIVLLSLAVNIVLLPVYHLAESWQEDERSLQKRMAPKLAEIKAVYGGRERDMFTRAIYRMFGYHPLMALRTSLGLLIQIPFFFAAYNLLHGNAALDGVSFFFIKNLGQPDALLSLGSFSANLLPFVMTAVNLASAAVYSARLTRRDKIQLYGLAALFLLLLYTAAAGLLLYWTCNNIFSFFKNIYYRRYVYEDARLGAPGAWLRGAFAAALNRAEALLALLPAKSDLPLMVLGIGALVLGESLFKKAPDPVSGTALIMFMAGLFAMLLAATAVLGRAAQLRKAKAPAALINYFALFFGFLVLLAVISMIRENKLTGALIWWYSRFYAAFFACAAAWLLLREPAYIFIRSLAQGAAARLGEAEARMLFFLGAAIIALLVFIYTPLSLYASDVEFFEETLASLLGNLSFMALVLIGIFAFAWHRAKGAIRPFMGMFLAWAAVCMLLYVFVAVRNYGPIEQMMFHNTSVLRSRLGPFVDLAVLAGSGLLLFFLLKKAGAKRLCSLMQGLCFALVLVCAYKLAVAPAQIVDDFGDSLEPKFSQRLWSFSPSGRNVIILMLDGFTGGVADKIFDANPELASNFEGFTLYSETMAPGARTLMSVPSILGGARYTPWAINSRKVESLADEMHKAFAELPGRFVPKDYDAALSAVYLLNREHLAQHLPQIGEDDILVVGTATAGAYVPLWRQKHGLPELAQPSRCSFMASVGLLYAAPWSIRSNIYANGRWLNTQSEIQQNISTLGQLAMLDIMADVANLDALKPNTFKYIAVQAKWVPTVYADSGLPPSQGKGSGEMLPGSYVALRSVAKLLDWLKTNNVYDNTQIILVSDHSNGDSPRFPPGTYKRFEDLSAQAPWEPHALLMVKNFGQRGPILVDRRLASVFDVVPLIAAENGLGQIYDYDNFLQSPTPDPQRLRTHDSGSSSTRRHKKDKFVLRHFEVRGDMFTLENWTLIENSNK